MALRVAAGGGEVVSHWDPTEPVELEHFPGESRVLVDCLLVLAFLVLAAVSPALVVLAYKAAF